MRFSLCSRPSGANSLPQFRACMITGLVRFAQRDAMRGHTMQTRTALVRGVGSHNGGAELLLRAAAEAVRTWGDRAAVDRRQVSSALRRDWVLRGYWGIQRFQRFAGTGLDMLPRRAAHALDLATWRHIDYVLDASGFSYGDQWSPANIEQVAFAAARWQRRGVPFILLPQSYGPFERPEIRSAVGRLFESATQIWVRDAVSMEHVTALLGADERVRMAPDITIGLHAPSGSSVAPGTVAVIPNINLATRKPERGGLPAYAQGLVDVITALRADGANAVLLLHSTHGDPRVVEECTRLAPDIEVIAPSNGLEAKAFIAQCDAVVSGRFHGLVSALSTGVPAIAQAVAGHLGEPAAERRDRRAGSRPGRVGRGCRGRVTTSPSCSSRRKASRTGWAEMP
ncbi:MAG: polysaccharide pyruvyl transferase family protein, partial [Microbacterium sp.]